LINFEAVLDQSFRHHGSPVRAPIELTGLPIGAQVVADFLADLTALDFAGRIMRPVAPPSFAL
jgi:hypothetical protein